MDGFKNNKEMNEAIEKEKRYWKKNFLWTALVLLAIVIYYAFLAPGIEITFGDQSVSILSPDKSKRELAYADITAVEFCESPDYGECLDGKAGKTCSYGQWQNEDWGIYYLSVYESADSCVLITAKGYRYAVSYSARDTTEALYKELEGKLAS